MEENLDIEETKDTEEIDEFEGEDTSVEFDGPFDASEIDVDIATINLGYLVDMLEDGEVDLDPEFQRSRDIWDKTQQSRLIESIMLGLPLPSFYFSEVKLTNKKTIIDGLQRLCTLKAFFIDKDLKLQGMQFLEYLNGKTYKDLDRSQIRRMFGLKITINTLRRNTPVNVKYVIFQRVNSAGTPLRQQEMRNALYQGKATRLLKELARFDYFVMATGHSISPKRMTDCDFVNRFLAFYLYYEEYDGNLDKFLGNTLAKINKMDDSQIEDLMTVFDETMCCCWHLFGDYAFRDNNNNFNKYIRINKALFDCVSVNIAWLSSDDKEKLVNANNLFQPAFENLLRNESFKKSISQSTSSRLNVEKRFVLVKQIINEILENDTETYVK